MQKYNKIQQLWRIFLCWLIKPGIQEFHRRKAVEAWGEDWEKPLELPL